MSPIQETVELKMHLLDLPLEVVRAILEDAVNLISHPYDLVDLRLVNSKIHRLCAMLGILTQAQSSLPKR